METKKRTVLFPVFYDVDPSEVRKQRGGYKKFFDKHEEDFSKEKVKRWRAALTQVASLSGWNLQDRSEVKLIKDIVHEIARKSNRTFSNVAEDLGTQAIEGIIMRDMPKQGIALLDGNSFSTMTNLRLLKITSNVQFSQDLEYLSNELRFLKWKGYPLKSLPSSFHPEKLFYLSMCYSNIECLWKNIKVLCMCVCVYVYIYINSHFEELKTMKLSYSCNILKTPDFTGVPNLERLELEGCTRLVELHPSIGFLKRLAVLNLKNCKNLVRFTTDISGLKSLNILNLYGCSKLEELPLNLEALECLEELDLPDDSDEVEIHCSMSMRTGGFDFSFAVPRFTTIESDHLWLGYLSRKSFECCGVKWTRTSSTGGRCIGASFGLSSQGRKDMNSLVKKCAIRLVYKRDVQHFEGSEAEGANTMADDEQQNNDMYDWEWSWFTEITMPSILERSSIRNLYSSRRRRKFDVR
ncbi:hypothetical protein JRO89_XS07G0285800 [Xanthoceras sorbifolium]|uniref:TIR domain-containing protein n=1 Tax=Xanthoceras sorbifolium TaxID=99658 RepID=A0ABQ8HVL0_9ROSI|nr:hypothetical protein JRO89_XS07G0285800 [Xanthoceras sorbifolium]